MRRDPWRMTLVAVAGLIVLACGGGSAGSGGSDTSDDPAVIKAVAFDICKDFVKNRLKAPSTARFRNFYEEDGEVMVTGSGEVPYTVVSSVDAENSFGGKLRNSFRCVVTREGTTWTLNDISIT